MASLIELLKIQSNRFQRVKVHVSIVQERRKCCLVEKYASWAKELTEVKSSYHFLANLNFLWEPLQQSIYHYQCSGQAYGDPHSRCNPSHVSHARSRFPLNFKPLHLNHHLSWSKVYSSGSLSNLEPGIPSSSARTVEDWSEMKMLAIYVFFPATRTELDFVWRSQKCHDVITAKRYSSCAHPQPRPPHPG